MYDKIYGMILTLNIFPITICKNDNVKMIHLYFSKCSFATIANNRRRIHLEDGLQKEVGDEISDY